MRAHLDAARDVAVETAREGDTDVVADQMSVETRRGKPCSSTSNRLLALSSSNTLLPANLHRAQIHQSLHDSLSGA